MKRGTVLRSKTESMGTVLTDSPIDSTQGSDTSINGGYGNEILDKKEGMLLKFFRKQQNTSIDNKI